MCWVSGTQGAEEKCVGCLACKGERRNVLGVWHARERGEIYKKCMRTLKNCDGVDWGYMIQDRSQQQAFVNMVMKTQFT